MSDIKTPSRPFLLAALTTGLLACGPTIGDGGGFGETGDESETGETGEGPEVEPPYGPEPGDGDSGDGDPGVGVAPVPGDGDGDPGDPGDDDRLRMVEFVCVDDECQGRWAGTDLWSLVSDASDVDGSAPIPVPWDCAPDIDVDVCVEVDEQGHIGCFWYQDGWAVAVAPSCSVDGDQWLDVGNDMRSSASLE